MHGGDFANRAVVHAGECLTHPPVVSPAETRDDREVLLGGHLARLQHAADAGGIDRNGLFDEHVLAGLDGVAKVLRTEVRRRGQQHHVDVVSDVLEIVESAETHLGHDVDPVADPRFLQSRQLALEPIAEGVAQGDQAGVRVGRESVDRRSAAATTATDQPDLQGLGALSRKQPRVERGRHGAADSRCCGFQHVASGSGHREDLLVHGQAGAGSRELSESRMFGGDADRFRIAQLIWPGRPRAEWESVVRSG